MYFFNRFIWSILLLFLIVHKALAQENLTAYWQPSFAINYKVTKTYSHNFSIQNRNYIFDDEAIRLTIRQLDFAHFSSLQFLDDQNVALGILYRLRENFDGGSNELRLTQQYNITSKPFVMRYGQRLRVEQRITKTRVTYRFRYRFSLDFPLQGEKLDVGEPYLVGNAESLLSAASQSLPQYDFRLTLHLGWKLSGRSKFQLGVEYRAENFSQNLQNVLFLLSAMNISF